MLATDGIDGMLPPTGDATPYNSRVKTSSLAAMPTAPGLFSYRKFWAARFGAAPFLPISRAEMDLLGWDSCDIILVTGDAYIDHPSFGMALVGRLLEAQGFRVGILAQPDWRSADAFAELGRPNLFFGITAGNMDSMVNRYTSERRMRSDDAYTPDGEGGKRPDRSVIVYAQRAREAFPDATLIIGGIEASLRRIAHFDYWSEKVRRSVLLDSKADLLVFGNGERQVVEIAHRLAKGEPVTELTDIRGTAFLKRGAAIGTLPEGWTELDSTTLDEPGPLAPAIDPYAMEDERQRTLATANVFPASRSEAVDDGTSARANSMPTPDADGVIATVSIAALKRTRAKRPDRDHSVIRLPAFEVVKDDPVLYAHASRVLHAEANPGNARALVQRHGDADVWLNPPPIPLTTKEMDGVYELPYQRVPHPLYGEKKIPAYKMIRFSVTIQRGCFGGCTFCSITEHEGRIIQNRSEQSVLKEIGQIRDSVPGFTGVISDLGGPTANMYRIACKTREIEAACRKPSCVFPGVCPNLNTDHGPLIQLYRKARELPGIKKVLVASGVRYDLAIESPEYVKELAQHHVGGYLKIAPEAFSEGPLSKMMKPGMGTYYKFKELFDKFSKEVGKEQYLIPYFIAAHPGTTDEDMLELAVWLKTNGFRADQVQAFLPSPMATATAMWHSGKDPLHKVTRRSPTVYIPKGLKQRRLHKSFLRYHDANNWPELRDALRRMGRSDLIGAGKHQLVPAWQPAGTGGAPPKPEGIVRGDGARPRATGAAPGAVQTFRTQHTGVESGRRPPPNGPRPGPAKGGRRG